MRILLELQFEFRKEGKQVVGSKIGRRTLTLVQHNQMHYVLFFTEVSKKGLRVPVWEGKESESYKKVSDLKYILSVYDLIQAGNPEDIKLAGVTTYGMQVTQDISKEDLDALRIFLFVEDLTDDLPNL